MMCTAVAVSLPSCAVFFTYASGIIPLCAVLLSILPVCCVCILCSKSPISRLFIGLELSPGFQSVDTKTRSGRGGLWAMYGSSSKNKRSHIVPRRPYLVRYGRSGGGAHHNHKSTITPRATTKALHYDRQQYVHACLLPHRKKNPTAAVLKLQAFCR